MLLPGRVLHHRVEHRADQRGRFAAVAGAALADDHHARRDRDLAFADDLQKLNQSRVAAADLLGDQLIGIRLGLGLDCHRLGLRLGGDDHLLLGFFSNLYGVSGRRQAFFFFGLLLGLGELFFLFGGPLLFAERLLLLQAISRSF